MQDRYHDTYHMHLKNISFSFNTEVFIVYHYSMCIELSASNDIEFVTVINNKNRLSTNKLILVVFRIY